MTPGFLSASRVAISVEGGAVPTVLLGPDAPSRVPAIVVVPSIYGPAPDLIERLAEFAAAALVVLPDPFWRVGGGPVPYHQSEKARARLAGFDLRRCIADLGAVLEWAAARGNGRLIGVGICFGGPFVLRFAGEGRLAGVVTWHGSRMENFLARAHETTCPLRLHFGSADPITPLEAIEKIRAAFAANPDVSIVVHPGAVHGFSHDGPPFAASAWRARECGAGRDCGRRG